MTDQTYKLVPVEPTAEMLGAGINGLSDSGIGDAYSDDSRHCYKSMIAVAPEPVCKWAFDDEECWYGTCGVAWLFTEGGPQDNDCNFCPKCGRKVEVDD